jgi:VWFA-related protein
VLLAGLAVGLSAQTPAAPQQPTFRVQVDLVTNDVIVRDEKGNFIPDLKKEDFEIYEDGVKQDISSMTVVTGGRVTNVLAPPPAPPPEGIILPPTRQVNDVSGRILVFFVDDLHLQFDNTGRVRQLFQRISKSLVHDGDMFGIVSSGPSSISIDMTYDKKRLDETITKITGSELKPSDIIQGQSGAQGPTEIRYRAHVAFSTMNELLVNLEKVHNRRKALVWVSDGYDFNPYQDSRLGLLRPDSPFQQNETMRQMNDPGDGSQTDPNNNPLASQQKQNEEFADADLARELGEVTRQANRANVSIYTIDPRGLVAMGDIGENVDPIQWNDFIRKSQDSLRVLADETGGIAVVNQNNFDQALKRIDAETSDYYVLGYYSKNPDPTKRRRQIEVKIARPGLTVWSRKEYVLRAAPAPPPPPKSKP